jgi:uncharacterized protein (DUF1684 family)
MKKWYFPFLLVCFLVSNLRAQNDQSAEKFQQELNEMYKNPEKSPLKKSAKKFRGHNFFPIDSALRVEAKFIRTLNAIPFQMKTTTSRLPIYEKYGEAHFTLEGRDMVLTVFQSHSSRDSEEYKDYLFLPYNDLTNGEESYTGGRYIDMRIPEGDKIVIDFNKSYNPYCAYSSNYSCPIPPQENSLDIKIRAGVKKPKKSKWTKQM